MQLASRFRSVELWGAFLLFIGSLAFFLLLSYLRSPDGLSHDGAYLLNLADQLWRGNGFVSPVLWQLYLAPNSLPMPYGAANGPLLSILVACFYWLFGKSLLVAHIPSVFFASLLAPLTFGLARTLRLDITRSFAAGVVTLVHPFLVPQSLGISPDTQHTAFVLAFLILLFGRVSVSASVMTGIAWGLAYLTRYQAVLLCVPLLIALYTRKDLKLSHVLVAGVAALVTVSPWLARNYLVFGKFMHSYATDYFLTIGTMPAGIDLVRDTAAPPAQLPYVLDYFGDYIAGVLERVRAIAFLLGNSLPGNAAVLLGGVVTALRCWRRTRRYLPLIGLATATMAFFALSYLESRYLMILCPMLAIAGITGLTGWRRRTSWSGERGVEIALISCVLVLSLSLQSFREARASASTSWQDRAAVSRATRPYFSNFRPWTVTIMGEAPEYHAYFHEQYAVSTPTNLERDLATLLEQYHVDFIVVQDSEVEYFRSLPAPLKDRIRVVYEIPKVLVYKVLPCPDS